MDNFEKIKKMLMECGKKYGPLIQFNDSLFHYYGYRVEELRKGELLEQTYVYLRNYEAMVYHNCEGHTFSERGTGWDKTVLVEKRYFKSTKRWTKTGEKALKIFPVYKQESDYKLVRKEFKAAIDTTNLTLTEFKKILSNVYWDGLKDLGL